MTDTLEEIETQHEVNGLARGIAVAGLQVAQAADELQQAAERLINAEGQAREAELRWKVAEEQIAQGATKNAELLEMLQSAREGQTEADERCRRAEQRMQITMERQKIMEEQLAKAEGLLAEAEAKPQVTVIVDDERTALQEAVAAEVRRPLTSILGLSLALRHADPTTAEGKDMIKQLSTNARKLDRLVGEMLDLDKIASGAFVPNLRRTDLEALVRRVVEESSDLANRDVRVEAEHVAISVNPALTEQMVETLLANAGRRTAPGNPVRVWIASDTGGVVIAVDDTGSEVPSGLRGVKFATVTDEGPGARGGKPRGATGLALLSRLALVHGGRAWVEEREGGGASFRVFLPDGDQQSLAVPSDEPSEEDDTPIAHTAVVINPLDERAVALANALNSIGDEEDDEDLSAAEAAAIAEDVRRQLTKLTALSDELAS